MGRARQSPMCPYRSDHCDSQDPAGDMMCKLCFLDYRVKLKESNDAPNKTNPE